jgi:FAD/FMN-containing dehydrogenase
MTLVEELKTIIEGDVDDSPETLLHHSQDTSIFQVMPEVVVFPKHNTDIQNLVEFVAREKKKGRNISLTGRSAGTDMTGGPLNESIIVSMTRYLNQAVYDESALEAVVEPGVYYRDFEKEMLPRHLTMPTYPASKTIAALGGMIMNNSAGERSLRYGQIREFVKTVDVVLSDGKTYTFGPLVEDQLREKLALPNFEGEIYRAMWDLITEHHYEIEANRPHVSKNSSGYALWRVWDPNTKLFNLAHLFVGSQGTLGLMTKAKLRIQREREERRMFVVFFKEWNEMPRFVNDILPFNPESLEAFDDATINLGIRFMPDVARAAGVPLWKFALRFLPEVGIGIKMRAMPKLIVIIEIAEHSHDEAEKKQKEIEKVLSDGNYFYRFLQTQDEEDKYWTMRRESFNLLRKHVNGKHTAPFIEDFCLDPKDIPSFLPEVDTLLRKHNISINITGHAGNGNFHIIPLMDLRNSEEREKIITVAEEYYKLVKKYGGSISAEHNDGILRTPYLESMFSEQMITVFAEVKKIFDPDNIFNPGKKVALQHEGIGTKEYLRYHIKTDSNEA